MRENIQVKVVSATPGANSNTYNMFDSTVAFASPSGGSTTMTAHDISRLELRLVNDQAGTLKFYTSTDGGTNWDQTGGDIAVAANAATDINGPYDFLIDPYRDVKLDWVNGGSAQTTWRPSVVLIRGDRSAAT
jgi:hypothetical protein